MKKVLTFLMLTAVIACSNDDEVIVDHRDMLQGSYTYTATVYAQDGTKNTSGYIFIEKLDADGISLSVDGEHMKGTKIYGNQNGIVFDLEPKNFVDQEGDSYHLGGVASYYYNNARAKYHAYYQAKHRTLSFALQSAYHNPEYTVHNSTMFFKARKR